MKNFLLGIFVGVVAVLTFAHLFVKEQYRYTPIDYDDDYNPYDEALFINTDFDECSTAY